MIGLSNRRILSYPRSIMSSHITTSTPTHWILRVADGENFRRSSRHHIWGIDAGIPDGKQFLPRVACGDVLWFVTGNSNGRVLAMATYVSQNVRSANTMSNEELGWFNFGPNCNTEIHYKDLYDAHDLDLRTRIKSPKMYRKYNPDKCSVNLPVEYAKIVQQGFMTDHM